MLETGILVLIQTFCIYLTVKEFKKIQVTPIDHKNMINSIFLFSFVAPLLEESLFRSVVKQYLTGFKYDIYINALLFGLSHSINYLYTHNLNMLFYQMITTTYLGYYVVQFDSFMAAFLAHAYYNGVIIIASWIIHQLLYGRHNVYTENNTSLTYGKLNYKETKDDLILLKKYQCTNSNKNYIQLGKNQIHKDMMERIKKLDNILSKETKYKSIYLTY